MPDNLTPNTFGIRCCSIDTDTGEAFYLDAELSIYLCPHCDNTHAELNLPDGGAKFGFSYTPKMAEAIAHALMNPPPARADELEKMN